MLRLFQGGMSIPESRVHKTNTELSYFVLHYVF